MSQTAESPDATVSEGSGPGPAVTRCPPTTGTLASREGDMLILALPGTDYRLHLVLDGVLNAEVGERVAGTIHAEALRVDRITAGGRYVEPVFGRPRRVQGVLVGADASAGAFFVAAGGATLSCTLTDTRQSLSDFRLHEMVTFDVKRGAVFRPM